MRVTQEHAVFFLMRGGIFFIVHAVRFRVGQPDTLTGKLDSGSHYGAEWKFAPVLLRVKQSCH